MDGRRSVGFELRTLTNLIRRKLDNSGTTNELDKVTGMHGWAIGFLYDNRDKDIFQRDIEEEFHIRRSTATRIMQLMEKNGLITRESVESDARLKKIVLTQKALDMHQRIVDYSELIEKQLTEGLTSQELDSFFDVIEKIKKNIE